MYIDIAISLLLIFAVYRGWKNGFVMELFSFLSIFVGIYVAIHFSDALTVYLREHQEIDAQYLPAISFIGLLIAVIFALYFLGKLLTATLKAGGAETINKIAGAVFALGKTILTLSIFFILFHSFDTKANILSEKQKEASKLYPYVYNFSLKVLPSLKESEFYQYAIEKINSEEESLQEE